MIELKVKNTTRDRIRRQVEYDLWKYYSAGNGLAYSNIYSSVQRTGTSVEAKVRLALTRVLFLDLPPLKH
jgi:hypothetical protein